MTKKHVTAIYPGTFDPLTLGHEDIVRRTAQLFDHVVVAVAVAHHKKTLFSLEERMTMARSALKDLPNVSVDSFGGLVRDFVVEREGGVMVRGVRSVTDFDYEYQLAGMNKNLMPHVETIFLMPNPKYQFVSSTFVREIATLNGDIKNFVSPIIFESLTKKLGRD